MSHISPTIIEHTPCPMCNAPAGTDCYPDEKVGDGGHGMRIDDFAREAPYEARLKVHIETEAALVRHYNANNGSWGKETPGPSLWLTEDEYVNWIVESYVGTPGWNVDLDQILKGINGEVETEEFLSQGTVQGCTLRAMGYSIVLPWNYTRKKFYKKVPRYYFGQFSHRVCSSSPQFTEWWRSNFPFYYTPWGIEVKDYTLLTKLRKKFQEVLQERIGPEFQDTIDKLYETYTSDETRRQFENQVLNDIKAQFQPLKASAALLDWDHDTLIDHLKSIE